MNNSNLGLIFGKVDTDDRKDDCRSGDGQCLAVDNTIVNEETVSGSRLDLQPVGKQYSADVVVNNGCTAQQWPNLAAFEDSTNGYESIITARKSLRRLGASAGGTGNSTLYLRPKITPKLRAHWQVACSLMADCHAILGNHARTLEHVIRLCEYCAMLCPPTSCLVCP